MDSLPHTPKRAGEFGLHPLAFTRPYHPFRRSNSRTKHPALGPAPVGIHASPPQRDAVQRNRQSLHAAFQEHTFYVPVRLVACEESCPQPVSQGRFHLRDPPPVPRSARAEALAALPPR